MHCPICKAQLQNLLKDCFVCPSGDGALITSSHLIEKDADLIKSVESYQHETRVNPPSREHEIPCPHCNQSMHQVNYSSTGIIIDSCLKCHYRWLDKGELSKIKEHKPQFKPEDTALLLSLDEQIHKVREEKDANPSYRLGSRSIFHSPQLFGITATRAVLKGLTHSRVTRLATVIVLIVTALIYYYVLDEFQT